MTLTEFLTARLDEDYEVAWGAEPSPWREGKWWGVKFDGPREVLGRHGDVTAVCYYGGTYGHVLRFDPTRVLADIEAKRGIVAACEPIYGTDTDWEYTDAPELAFTVLRALALTYADHPDFREEWKS